MKKDDFKIHYQNDSNNKLRRKNFPGELTIVAEGDSWFKYPFKTDIIDHLREKGYAIKNYAKAGDTLENMVYGTKCEKIRDNKIVNKGPQSLKKTSDAIKKYKPHVVLFSAGGNDIVGPEILNYLNHRGSKKSEPINKTVFSEKLKDMEDAIEHFISTVRKAKNGAQIIMDGYDYALPNGKAYKFLGVDASGPWILPSMGKKNITTVRIQKEIIKFLVDEFNEMLIRLDNKHQNFHHIDLRNSFPLESNWDNEIHLNGNEFQIVAGLYHQKICQLLGHNPLVSHASVLNV